MVTFHWSELLIVVVCGAALVVGLAFLMLRRRNEILQKFLTPEEPDIEAEFFRVRTPKQEEVEEETAEPNTDEEAEASETDEASVRWGATDGA